MKFLATLLLSLASFYVQAQPSTDPPPTLQIAPALFGSMPELQPIDSSTIAGALAAIPLCSGPDSKWNTPQFLDGVSATFGHVTVAWCAMIDGQVAAWVRMRPPGDTSVNAPIAFITDTAKRPAVKPVFTVAANGTSKTRWSYISIDPTTGKLGALVGRATVGAHCVCGNDMVVYGPTTWCTFTGALATEVTICTPASSMAMPGM